MSLFVKYSCLVFIFYKSSLFAGRHLPLHFISTGQIEAVERLRAAGKEISRPTDFLVFQLIGIVFSGDKEEWLALVSGSTPAGCVFENGFCVDWAAALPSTADIVEIASFILPFSSWRLPLVALLQSLLLVLYIVGLLITFELVLPRLINLLIRANQFRLAALIYASARLVDCLLTPFISIPLYISAFSFHPYFPGCLFLHIFNFSGTIFFVTFLILLIMSNPSGVNFRMFRSQLRQTQLDQLHTQVIELWAQHPEKLKRLSLTGFLAVASALKKTQRLPRAVVFHALAHRIQLRGLVNLSALHFSELSETAKSLL